MPASTSRPLTADERFLLTHINMFGSDGYPIRKVGKRWLWSSRSLESPVLYGTRRETVESFESFIRMLRGLYAAEVNA